MTAPVVHGFPDYGRYVARAAKIFTNIENAAVSIQVDHGPYFVGDIANIGIDYGAVSCDTRVIYSWYADQALTTLLGSHTFSVRGSGELNVAIPVIGPWLRVSVAPISGSGTYSLALFETSHATTRITWSSGDSVLSGVNDLSIPSLGTTVVDIFRTWPGWASFTIITDATDWYARIFSINAFGTSKLAAAWDEKSGTRSAQIILPPTMTALHVRNGDAAAKLFSWALVAQTFPQ